MCANMNKYHLNEINMFKKVKTPTLFTAMIFRIEGIFSVRMIQLNDILSSCIYGQSVTYYCIRVGQLMKVNIMVKTTLLLVVHIMYWSIVCHCYISLPKLICSSTSSANILTTWYMYILHIFSRYIQLDV